MNKILVTQRIGRDKYGEYYDYIESNYIKFFNKYNITPILLPNNIENAIKFYETNNCSKIILTGGDDISCLFTKNQQKSKKNYLLRDKHEKKLIKYAIKKKIPVFCICRGFQIMNTCLGGKLTKNINSKFFAGINRHKVIFTDDYKKKVKMKSITVNSFHNHGIAKNQLSHQLVPLGYTYNELLVEIYTHKHLPITGIQWHPERISYSKKFDDYIFKKFIKIKKQ